MPSAYLKCSTAQLIMPTGSILNAYNGTGPEAVVLYVSIILIVVLAILLLKIPSKMKQSI